MDNLTEEKAVTEVPPKKRMWLRITIFLLSIALVGQFSAIYIPALAGQPTQPNDFLSTLVSPSLLFMAIWSLRGKKKIVGFLLGICIGVIFFVSAALTSGYMQRGERIEQAVAKVNEDLPRMVDEDTSLDSISIDQKSKNYNLNISLVNLSLPEIDIDALHEIFELEVKPNSCNNKNFKEIFKEGYKINFSYKDKDGLPIMRYTINKTDCK